MADNPTPAEPNLEQATNEVFGDMVPHTQVAVPEPTAPEPAPEPAAPAPPAAPAAPQPGQALPEEIIKALSETPYKSVDDLIRGYKEIQGQFTHVREKVKPHEQLLNDIEADANLQNFVQQAITLYRNPQLASAYATPQGNIDSPPDPRNYDMFNPEQSAKFYQDMDIYNQRKVDAKISQRLSYIEAQNALEKQKADFKQLFPDANPDDVLKMIQSKKNWTLTDHWKALDYDNLKSKALEEARKELTKKLEDAQRSGTPSAPSAPSHKATPEEILDHISRYGSESAKKKYGAEEFAKTMRDATF